MSDNEKIKKLIRAMCIALVRQTININWYHPIIEDFRGQAYLESGVITFDIDPEQSIDEIYKTALHECGHCIAGHELAERRDLPAVVKAYSAKGPLMNLNLEESETYAQKPEELEAEAIRKELDRIARDHSLDLFGNDDIESRIIFLSQVQILRQEEEKS